MRILTHRKTRGKRNRTRHEINAEREKVHVVKGDTVRVVRGDDKGKEGKIIRVLHEDGPRGDRRREHREEASQGAPCRGAVGDHRDARAAARVERDAARPEVWRADAHSREDRRRRNEGAHQRKVGRRNRASRQELSGD